MNKVQKEQNSRQWVEPDIVVNLVNDEPVDQDALGRTTPIAGLVSAIKNCQTPFVMAINGGWGTGKTSLLKCLERELKDKEGEKIRTVWFSSWKFQFEESPAVSLLQFICHTALQEKWIKKGKIKRKAFKIFEMTYSLAGEVALKVATVGNIGLDDLKEKRSGLKKKYLEAKQLITRMQEEFQQAIGGLVGQDGRLILFIDDLDRCRSANSLRLLEALKVFLNAGQCVFVLAIDMDNLVKNLEKEGLGIKNAIDYLDKIFQLVYTLPATGADKEKQLVKDMMDHDPGCPFKEEVLIRIAQDLALYMADNPRAIKQFCNRFRLESAIIEKELGAGYNPNYHVFLQFLQHCFPAAFKLFRERHQIQVLRTSPKHFDKFIWNWAPYLPGYDAKNRDTAMIRPGDFKLYFPFLPSSDVHHSLFETHCRFATVDLISGQKVLVCLEDLPENEKMRPEANLSDIKDLANTVLRDIDLSGCRLDRCHFDGADLRGANLSEADCSFSGFRMTRFEDVNAQKTDFSNSDMTDISYESAVFSEASFEKTIGTVSLEDYINSQLEKGKQVKLKKPVSKDEP